MKPEHITQAKDGELYHAANFVQRRGTLSESEKSVLKELTTYNFHRTCEPLRYGHLPYIPTEEKLPSIGKTVEIMQKELALLAKQEEQQEASFRSNQKDLDDDYLNWNFGNRYAARSYQKHVQLIAAKHGLVQEKEAEGQPEIIKVDAPKLSGFDKALAALMARGSDHLDKSFTSKVAGTTVSVSQGVGGDKW